MVVTHWAMASSPSGPDSLRLATFNLHLGVDGWARPYDVVATVAALDADVLVLQECWTPDDGSGLVDQLVATLGYQAVLEVPLARGVRFAPDPDADGRWGPRPGQMADAMRLEGSRAKRPRRDRPAVPGTWGMALLARVTMTNASATDLPRLRRDRSARAVLFAETPLGARSLLVTGVHMSHLTFGSPLHFRRLWHLLPATTTPAVVAGDMNCWGPPVSLMLPGWRRAIAQPTWPTHRPHSQLDHVLVTPPVRVTSARVGPHSGSDHRPVVVDLALT